MARLTTLRPRVATLENALPLGAQRTKKRLPRDYDKPWSGDARTTTQKGLGWSWQKLRRQILDRDMGLCQCDECKGGHKRVTRAAEVDHIIPRAWFEDGRAGGNPNDPANLRAVSKACHRRITLQQQGKRSK